MYNAARIDWHRGGHVKATSGPLLPLIKLVRMDLRSERPVYMSKSEAWVRSAEVRSCENVNDGLLTNNFSSDLSQSEHELHKKYEDAVYQVFIHVGSRATADSTVVYIMAHPQRAQNFKPLALLLPSGAPWSGDGSWDCDRLCFIRSNVDTCAAVSQSLKRVSSPLVLRSREQAHDKPR